MKTLAVPRKLIQAATRMTWRVRLERLGRGADIQSQTRFEYAGRIAVGRHACIARGAIMRANTEASPGIEVGPHSHVGEFTILAANRGHIRLGQNSWIGSHCELQANGGIDIGNDVMIGSHCVLNTVAHNSDRTELPMRQQGLTCEPIHIEDDVWLGARVTVLKGVRIGRGSIIGAGGVVTRDIPANSIAVGVPARVVGQRAVSEKGELVDLAPYLAEGESCR